MSDAPAGPGWWQAGDGRWYPPPIGPPVFRPGRTTNTSAVLALVLGILALTSCYFVTGIPAIVFGRRAQREIDASGGTEEGRGMATVGLVMGIVATALSVLLLIVAIVFFVALLAADGVGESDVTPVTISVPR